MFGLSFGEVVLLVIIGVVVIGPRNLPQMLRSLGRTVGKVRRAATDLREQSGIDEILRAEGLEKEVQELRKIAQGRILDVNLEDDLSVSKPVRIAPPPRTREYPTGGPDTYGALPEDAGDYAADAAGPAAPAAQAGTAAAAPVLPEATEPKRPVLAAPEEERLARSSSTSLGDLN